MKRLLHYWSLIIVMVGLAGITIPSLGRQEIRAAAPNVSHSEPPGVTLSSTEREARLARVRAGVEETLRSLDRSLARPNATPSIRDLPNAALAKLLLGEDPKEAERLLDMAFAQQDMNPDSPRYGFLPWQIGHPEIVDDNAIEFGTQAIGPILLHYGNRLSPEFKAKLIPHIRAAFSALRQHKIKVSYTNIFLMETVNLILMGEAIGDKAAADEGYSQLDNWIDYTRQAGIHEFDSPTYYAVDLNSLGLGYLYAARPGAKAKFKAILDYFWRDMAANFFAGRGSLSGPHSRDYDFLNGGGGLDLFLYIEGLRRSQNTAKLDLEKSYLLEDESERGYHPDAKILSLVALPERVITGKWDTEPGRDRYNYITPDFSIGSATGDYGPQDKMIDIEMASADSGPVISIVPDTYDEPYGRLKVKDRSGHNKPHHLPLHLAAVQQKGALLALLDLDAHRADSRASLATNILLPKAASLTLDGQPVSLDAAFERSAKLNSVLGAREGKAGIGIRVFQADGSSGQEPAFFLKLDPAGLKYGAARFVIYHYRGDAQVLKESHLRVGLLMMAAKCASDGEFVSLLRKVQDTGVEEHSANGTWEVKATSAGLSLEVGRDLIHRQILYRRVDGTDFQPQVFSVNGQDMASWPDTKKAQP